MKWRPKLWLVSALLFVGSATLVLSRPAQPGPLAAMPVDLTDTTSPAQADVTTLNPLQIEAIRARKYVASPVVDQQDLGDQGGYHNYIVSFTSDGLKEFALESVPNTTAPTGGYPVVVLAHGYIQPDLYQTNGPEYREFIASLARAGFVVIKPDYRGHGQSQGVPEGGHYSPVYAYDLLNLVQSLKAYPLVNGNRIGLLGHSLGGHEVLRTAVASPDVKATVIAAGVVGSMYDLFYNWTNTPQYRDQPTAVVQGNLQSLVANQGNPKTNPDFWNSVSAINYVKYITGAVQIDVGTADEVVPPLFSQHLDQALVAAGKPVEYYTYAGGDHQFSDPAIRQLFLSRAISFFKANL